MEDMQYFKMEDTLIILENTRIIRYSNFTGFKSFICINNALTEIPEKFSNCMKLHHNNIKNIRIQSIYSLQFLDISYNLIEFVPNLTECINLTHLNISNNMISKIEGLPINLKIFNGVHNQLTELFDLPNSLIELYLSYNKLKKIVLNDGLIILHIYDNVIEDINIPDSIEVLYGFNNKISKLQNLSQKNIKELYLFNNLLTEIPQLNIELTELSVASNPITKLTVFSPSLKELYFYDTPIYDILCSTIYEDEIKKENILLINNIYRKLYNAKYLYYCLKYKNQFMKLLAKINL